MSGDTTPDGDQRLSEEEAQALIKAIEEVEREEAGEADTDN
jgi:hypothetical protein